MRFLIATSLLFTCLALPQGYVNAQTETEVRGMSGIEIIEGLTSPDPGIRDRAKEELTLMDEESARELGRELLHVGVREAQSALVSIGGAGNVNAVHAAAAGLDSDEHDIRAAALDALIQLSPTHTAEAGGKALKEKRKEIIRELIEESSYVQDLCEGLTRDTEGQLVMPVTKSMRLMTLMDALYAEKAMSMVLQRIGQLMVGDAPDPESEKTQTRRDEEERLRRSAALWCEAIWIKDPAIAFNYSPVAPFEERHKAVNNLTRTLKDLTKVDVSTYKEEYGPVKRFGDYLLYVTTSDYIKEYKYTAGLRLKWWRGDKLPLEGEGYFEAFEEYNEMRSVLRKRLLIQLGEWWMEHRTDSGQ